MSKRKIAIVFTALILTIIYGIYLLFSSFNGAEHTIKSLYPPMFVLAMLGLYLESNKKKTK
jgi:uncharacterized membrane protein